MVIIPVKPLHDPLVSVAAGFPDEERETIEHVVCDAQIEMGVAFMASRPWEDEQRPGRPYLRMMGEVTSLVGEFPYGVSQMRFEEIHRPVVDLIYEFSDDELSDLVHKGLYTKGFQVPEVLSEAEQYELPVEVTLHIVAPEVEGDVPFFFVEVENQHALETDAERGYYVLGQLFEQAEVQESSEMSLEEGPLFNSTIDFSEDFDLENDPERASRDMFADLDREDEAELVDDEELEEDIELSEEDKQLIETFETIQRNVMENHVIPRKQRLERAKGRENEVAVDRLAPFSSLDVMPEDEPMDNIFLDMEDEDDLEGFLSQFDDPVLPENAGTESEFDDVFDEVHERLGLEKLDADEPIEDVIDLDADVSDIHSEQLTAGELFDLVVSGELSVDDFLAKLSNAEVNERFDLGLEGDADTDNDFIVGEVVDEQSEIGHVHDDVVEAQVVEDVIEQGDEDISVEVVDEPIATDKQGGDLPKVAYPSVFDQIMAERRAQYADDSSASRAVRDQLDVLSANRDEPVVPKRQVPPLTPSRIKREPLPEPTKRESDDLSLE